LGVITKGDLRSFACSLARSIVGQRNFNSIQKKESNQYLIIVPQHHKAEINAPLFKSALDFKCF